MNKKIYIFTLPIIILLTIFVAILPIQISSNLKEEIIQNKKEQINLINEKIQLIPEIINISKGYIINDEETLKDIIKINILSKEQTSNLITTYNNHIELLNISMKLINDSKEHILLTSNKDFMNSATEIENLYKMIELKRNDCMKSSNLLLKISNLPIYKNIIKMDDIGNYICNDI